MRDHARTAEVHTIIVSTLLHLLSFFAVFFVSHDHVLDLSVWILIDVPVTVRQLESLVRLTQARARMQLRNIATSTDASEVVALVKEAHASVEDMSGGGMISTGPGGRVKGTAHLSSSILMSTNSLVHALCLLQTNFPIVPPSYL